MVEAGEGNRGVNRGERQKRETHTTGDQDRRCRDRRGDNEHRRAYCRTKVLTRERE